MSGFAILSALAAGVAINVVDVACTLLFAVKSWDAELRRQGLEPRRWTPPYYVATNFVGGILLTIVYLQFASTLGPHVITALYASVLVWLASRIYGGGHVVMGQMPLGIFVIMSSGLGLG